MSKRRENPSRKGAKQSMPPIVLHSFGRFDFPRHNFWLSDVSPFVAGLETFLRMCELPYEVCSGVGPLGGGMSSKGKMPWLEVGGERVEDSHFCTERVFEAAGPAVEKAMRGRLAPDRRAALHAATSMIKNGLYWGIIYHRYRTVGLKHIYMAMTSAQVPRWFAWFVTLFGRVTIGALQLWGQGYGRHTQDEVDALDASDLRALDALLGDDPYFGGNAPCEFDATAFGFIVGITDMWDSADKTLVENELPRLKAFVERVKARYWPDWGTANNTDGWQP